MQQQIYHLRFGQLRAGALFKLGLVCNLAIWLIIGLLLGLAGLAGYNVVSLGGENVYGVAALITAIVLAGVFSGIGTVMFVLGGLLVRLFGKSLLLPVNDYGIGEESKTAEVFN